MMSQTEEQPQRPPTEGAGVEGPSIQNLQQSKVTLKVPVNVNKILIADIGKKRKEEKAHTGTHTYYGLI
jgi:hypothetical protein